MPAKPASGTFAPSGPPLLGQGLGGELQVRGSFGDGYLSYDGALD